MPVLKRKNAKPRKLVPVDVGFGSFRERKLVELGLMMYTEGEDRDKQPRMSTSPSEQDFSVNNTNTDDTATSQYNGRCLPHMSSMHHNDQNRSEDYLSSSPGSPGTDKSYIPSRKQREFIPENRKDNCYWEKRRKNNEAARRSREKRRLHDFALENKICDLNDENRLLRKELIAVKKKFGVPLDKCFTFSDDEQSDTSATSASQPGMAPLARPGETVTTKTHVPHPDVLSQATIYTSPPPLLAVAGAVPMSVPVQGIPYTNGAAFPYYLMPSSEAHSRMNHEMNPYRARSDERMNSEPQDPVPASSVASRPSSLYHQVAVKKEPGEERDRPINACISGPSSTAPQQSPEMPIRGEYQHHLHDQDSQPDAWMDSNSNSYTSDDAIDEPLQLTVNTTGKDMMLPSRMHYSADSRSPPTTLPLKLRHKEFYTPSSNSSPYSTHPYMDGLAQLSEIALAQANPLPLVKKSRDYGSRMSRRASVSGDMDPKMLDPKYLERRRRNNEAARKCRENRKALTRLREAKSDYLEGENNKLRDEMEGLTEEVKQLRDLIEKKQVEHEIKQQHHTTDPPDTSSSS
ncbi:transcription factor atf-2-like isoform X1 [Haliotis cracherodii]|uniref:transcription factor atf-2-like isoform X1 n=2 Tax=Haliotis cracherodii TaxID=6455 RepID=UPI0039E8140B